jgi:NAD(P)-dependent dehydrogenase (short-subunit alcohol dehydrogenase family)
MPQPDGQSLLGKIALVTGSSRGLGRNMAVSIARKGADVIVTYFANRAEAETVVAEIAAMGRKAVALQFDAGDIASLDGFVGRIEHALSDAFGRSALDFLVNNAGIAVHAMIAETPEADFDRAMNVHFKGVFFLTQKLLPVIADGGRIVNISSGLTRFSMPGYATYAAMKGAIEVFTRYLAKELGPRGIAVNTVAPGAIATDFGGGAVRDNPEYNKAIAAQTALGRVGLPDDIGPMVAALLGEDNRWITAQRIEVSGGMFL